MKKVLMIALALALTFSMAACGQIEPPESTAQSNVSEPGGQIPITITVGDTVLDAYLND